jgi:hypothetical protein
MTLNIAVFGHASSRPTIPPALFQCALGISTPAIEIPLINREHAEYLEICNCIGRMIATKGHKLLTGACRGGPQYANEGAKEAGGTTVGYSPSTNAEQHERELQTDPNKYEMMHYLPACLEYYAIEIRLLMRDIVLVHACDCAVLAGGLSGSAHEGFLAAKACRPLGIVRALGLAGDALPEFLRSLGWADSFHSSDCPEQTIDWIIQKVQNSKISP